MDPNDFTLFGNVEDCSSDQNFPKLQDKVKEDQLELTNTSVDRDKSMNTVQCTKETTNRGFMIPVLVGGRVQEKPLEAVGPGEGMEKSNARVSVEMNHGSEKPSSDMKKSLISESLPTLRKEVGEQITRIPNNSTSTENSRLRALLICDSFKPAPSTSSHEQTNPATSTKTAPDAPIQVENAKKPLRRVLKFSSCTLHPPKTACSQPVAQDKPPGCKTIWVGGLPSSVTEEIIREIFERFGNIVELKREKRSYHVRFEQDSAVDSAVSLSGHRLVVGGSTDPSDSRLLFVDYVKYEEDQLEWDYQQRKSQNQDHPAAVEKTGQSTTSPPVHCTESDIAKAIDLIKRDDRFLEAVQLLSRWLEMDDYDKKNSDKIYSMIQQTNDHARRLQTEKKRRYEELKRARNQCRIRAEAITSQISHIERLFTIISRKKVLDHFSDAQKTSLIQWKTEFLKYQEQIEDLTTEVDDSALLGANEEQAMRKPNLEVNETLTKSSPNVPTQIEISALKNKHQTELASKNGEIQRLKTSLESVKKQLAIAEEMRIKKDKQIANLNNKKVDKTPRGPTKGYYMLEKQLKDCTDDLIYERKFVITLQTEISELKRWLVDEDYNNKQLIKKMNENEREYQQTLTELNKRLYDREVKLGETERRLWEIEMNRAEAPPVGPQCNIVSNQRMELARLTKLREQDREKIETLEQELRNKAPAETIDDRDAKTISMISAFLLIHPFGVGINFITQYVQRMEPTASSIYIQSILFKYPAVFRFDTIENKWTLNVNSQLEAKDKRAEESPSRDASGKNAADGSSQSKKAPPKTRPPASQVGQGVGTSHFSSPFEISSQVHPPASQTGQAVGTGHLPGRAFQMQPPTHQIGQSIGTTSQASGLASKIHPQSSPTLPPLSQIQPPLSQIQPQPSQIQPQPFQMQPQPFQMQPQPFQMQPQPFQMQPQPFQMQPQPSQIQPQPFKIPQPFQIQLQPNQIQSQPFQIKPRPSQMQPQPSQMQPQPSQMQPQPSQIQSQPYQTQPQPFQREEQREGVELRKNGLSSYEEGCRLLKLLKKFRDSSKWSPQLLRRLQEISVYRQKNTFRLRASKRLSAKAVVPPVSDEVREIYKHTVTIPEEYPEEEWLRLHENTEEFSSDSISDTRVPGYYPFNAQCSTSPASPTNDGGPQKACNIAEKPDSAFKTPEDFPSSSQNRNSPGFWLPSADKKQPTSGVPERVFKIPREPLKPDNEIVETLAKTEADEEHRLARIVSYLPNHYEWSFALQARMRFFKECSAPQLKQQFSLRTLDGKEVEVNLPKVKLRKLAKFKTTVIPSVFPEEYILEKRKKPVGEQRVLPAVDEDRYCIGGLKTSMELLETKPELPKGQLETADASMGLESITSPEESISSPEEATEEPIGLRSIPLKSSLLPQIPYRKPSMLNVQQDQLDQPVKKRHCPGEPQEPPAKVKKITLDGPGKDAQHSDAKTPDNKVSEFLKPSKILETVSKPEDDSFNVNDKAKSETKFSGSGKSDGGESSQNVAKLDTTEIKKILQHTKSSVHSQSSKKHRSSDTNPEGKGLKHDAIIAREKMLRDSKKSGRSSEELKKNRLKTTDSKRTSSIKEESRKRELDKHKNIASSSKNAHREKETAKSKDMKMRRSKKKDENLSVDSGGDNKDAVKKEVDKSIVFSDSNKSLPKHIERGKHLTTGAEAKYSVSSESSNRESCLSDKNDTARTLEHPEKSTNKSDERLHESVTIDSKENCSKQDSTQLENKPEDLGVKFSKDSLVVDKKINFVGAVGNNDTERRTIENPVKSTKESLEKLQKPCSNESVAIVSREDCLKQDSPKDHEESPKVISVDTSDALKKSNQKVEFVEDTRKGNAKDHITQTVENSGTSGGSSQKSRKITKNEVEGLSKDVEQENFDQKCQDFRKKYLELAKKIPNMALLGKGLTNGVSNEKQSESPIGSMTFAEFLSSRQPKGTGDRKKLTKKPKSCKDESTNDDESRRSSEKTRKRCLEREGVLPIEPEASSSKKPATEGNWVDVMQSLDHVPKKHSKPIKISENTQLKKNVDKKTLESIPVKSSKTLEQPSNSQVKKRLCGSPSEPKIYPKIRIKSLEKMRNPSEKQDSPKAKKKASVVSNTKSDDAGANSSKKATSDPLEVSVEKTANQQPKEKENPGISLINQTIDKDLQKLHNPSEDLKELGRPTEICRPDKQAKEKQLECQIGIDEPKLECVSKKDLMDTDESEQIYETSSKNAQELRNELQQLFGDPEEPGDASQSSEKHDDFYCDTYWSSEDILRLSREDPE